MADPFTIRIFVPDGDPEGVRLIDRMNWTGLWVVFPRTKWPDVHHRTKTLHAGVFTIMVHIKKDYCCSSFARFSRNATSLAALESKIWF